MDGDESYYALRELPADSCPERVFAALAACPGRIWLDSSLRNAQTGAYSILSACPYARLEGRGNIISSINAAGLKQSHPSADILADLQEFLNAHRTPSTKPPAGIPFAGGAIGFIGYDVGRSLERISERLPVETSLPDFAFMLYDSAIVFDHQNSRTWAVACGLQHNPGKALAALLARVQGDDERMDAKPPLATAPVPALANFTRREFCQAVQAARDYIACGDIYQVNLAQRFRRLCPPAPGSLYQRLRQLNPSPYGAFLDFGAFQILSSSPERFLRLRGNRINTRPIKGTRPRGASEMDDARLRKALWNSRKERAELLMIVDLERNDLGRICRYGSIRVNQLYHLESYATVHHLIASVSGTLRQDVTTADVLRATFPGGSITGAPKIRAMEIIEELETVRRHVFTGSIGYFAAHGDIDLNIAIRTIVRTDAQADFHVGSGIVWDSDPEAEYEETLAKGKALFAALNIIPQI